MCSRCYFGFNSWLHCTSGSCGNLNTGCACLCVCIRGCVNTYFFANYTLYLKQRSLNSSLQATSLFRPPQLQKEKAQQLYSNQEQVLSPRSALLLSQPLLSTCLRPVLGCCWPLPSCPKDLFRGLSPQQAAGWFQGVAFGCPQHSPYTPSSVSRQRGGWSEDGREKAAVSLCQCNVNFCFFFPPSALLNILSLSQ